MMEKMRDADDAPLADCAAKEDPAEAMRDQVFDIWRDRNSGKSDLAATDVPLAALPLPSPATDMPPLSPPPAALDMPKVAQPLQEDRPPVGKSPGDRPVPQNQPEGDHPALAIAQEKADAPQRMIHRDNHQRISSIVWPNGDVRHFEYFGESNDLSKIIRTIDHKTLINERSSATSLTWNVRDFNGQIYQSWCGQVKLSQESGDYSTLTTDRRGKSADGTWSAVVADGTRVGERTQKDGTCVREERGGTRSYHPDGRQTFISGIGVAYHYDKQGCLDRIASGDQVRAFTYDAEGKLDKLIEQNGSSVSVIFDRSYSHCDVTDVKVSPDGALTYVTADGTRIMEVDGARLESDSRGLPKRLICGPAVREFGYDSTTCALNAITDRRPSEKGDRIMVWRNGPGDPAGTFNFIDSQGKAQRREQVRIAQNGEIHYKRADSGDQWLTSKLNAGDTDVDAARETFLSSITPQLGEARSKRLDRMMKDFEQRMTDQVELAVAGGGDKQKEEKNREQCIIDTYRHMARLVTNSDHSKTIYDQKTRAMLAENFIYHAADPRTIEQGSTGTCWWESSYAVGFERRAQHLARFVTDIALTGSYLPTSGGIEDSQNRNRRNSAKANSHQSDRRDDHNRRDASNSNHPRYTLRDARNIRISGSNSRGGDWSIEAAHKDSRRSPICMIIDQVAPAVGGARREGRPDSGDHDEARNILKKLTGEDLWKHARNNQHVDRREARAFAEAGGFTESGGGHMWSYCMRKVNGAWLVIKNDQYQGRDKVVGVLSPDKLASFLREGGLQHRNSSRELSDYRPDSQNIANVNWSDKISDIKTDSQDLTDNDDSPRRTWRPFRRRFR